ncbi:MAG TPA: hypothetical protein PLU67_00335 [Candidatus Kapabacteria bacterium]|nr:hypothetical protein [Candidatus Kapabacteria bacterium]HOM03920.1 hypothetical protein [Candidatus Kapabacteria bacterium]
MKNKLFRNIYVVAILVAVLGLTSCQKDNPVEPIENGLDYSMVLLSPEAMIGEVSQPSLTTDFTLLNVYDKMLIPPIDGKGKGPNGEMPPKPEPNKPPFKIGMLLRMLELDSAQREQVKIFAQELEDCIKEYRQMLREAQRAIIENANAQRREIMEQLKTGEITREQAMQALRQLREETRIAMETDEDIATARQGLKDCHDAFLENVKSILTTKQLDIWNRFFGIKG